jgi:hypothetical protein
MFITAVLILLVTGAIVLLVRAARGHSAAGIVSLLDLQGRTVAIDVTAFRNLISGPEESYLHRSLPPPEFRRIQRKRMRAAAAYIRGALHNAAILLRLGEAAQRSADPTMAAAGRKLVDTAVRLRLYAFFALLQLYLNIMLPGLRLSPVAIADRYEVLTEAMARFTRLQQPGLVTRISLSL